MAHLGYIQLTRECMQDCIYCSNPPTGIELDLAGVRKTLDHFLELGCDGVILTGGEPTLSPLFLKAIQESNERKLSVRVITNGQVLSNFSTMQRSIAHGLKHIHLSLYSHRPEIHDGITGHKGSWRRAIGCLENASELDVTCDINTVISKRNADHLHEIVDWLCKRFPSLLRHFVWNNLDSSGERARAHPEVIARLRDFEVSLDLAMEMLSQSGRSFRAERVPLCAMRRFPWASTETRKIVKEEARSIRFLDSRELFHQSDFNYNKGQACSSCHYRSICAGLFMAGEHLHDYELSPVFEDPVEVVRTILGREPTSAELEQLGKY